MTPQRFFEDICPKLLAAQRDACAKLGGSYAIKLTGDGGGTWTVDFPTASVSKGLKKRPDVTLEIGGDDFTKMMQGALDVVASMKAGRLKVHGDARKMGNLATILGAGLS
jgi:putative sterol carrier protein